MKKGILLFALSLSLSLAASAQTKKQLIYVECTTSENDWVGKRLCTELRDVIARSPRYQETESDATEWHWNLHLVSVRHDDTVSAQSVALTRGSGTYEIYVTNSAFNTGRDQVQSQAEAIFADADNQVRRFK